MDSISVQGQVAIAALILISLLLVIKFLMSWLKEVFLHRLPKPYLGDGPNVEWAMKKRAEFEEGKLIFEPSIDEPSEPVAWHLEETGDKPKANDDNLNGSENWHIDFEAPSGEQEEMLLQSWLKDTNHIDDAWVERLLQYKERFE